MRLYYQTSWTFRILSELKWYQSIPTHISVFQDTFSLFSTKRAVDELIATTSCIHPANLAPFHGHESFTARPGSLWMCASHLFLASSLSRKHWLLSLGFFCSRVPAELQCHWPWCCCGAFPISKGYVMGNHSRASMPGNPKPSQLWNLRDFFIFFFVVFFFVFFFVFFVFFIFFFFFLFFLSPGSSGLSKVPLHH